MPQRGQKKDHNILDYLLYALAGGALLTVSFSVVLWLSN